MVIYQLRSRSKDFRRVWPCFRGKRAGRRAKERVNRCRYSIEVQLTNRINHSRSSRRHRNKVNCVTMSLSQQDQQGARKVYVPSVLLSNVMSLAPKLDEVSYAITYENLDIACITEIWLRDHIHDNVVSISGYNLVRRNRIDVTHGGVCTYINKGLKYTVLEDLYGDKIEAIWLQLHYHPQTDKGVLILRFCIISTIQCLQLNRSFRTVEFWSLGILTGSTLRDLWTLLG